MVGGNGRTVHVRGNQGVAVQRFFNRDAADEGRDFARDLIESAKLDVLCCLFQAGFFEERLKAGPGEPGIADRAFAPLDSGNPRGLKRAAVARALQRVGDGMDGDFREIGERQRDRFFYLSGDGHLPSCHVDFGGLEHVIADKEVIDGRDPVGHEPDRRFEIEKAVGTNDHAIFAWDGNGRRIGSPCEKWMDGPGSECSSGCGLQKVATSRHSSIHAKVDEVYYYSRD
jgi:hypothetical protein